MRADHLKKATDMMSGTELAKVIKQLDSASFDAVNDPESPYHVISHNSEDKESDAGVKYHYPNLMMLMQDIFITPVSRELSKMTGLESYLPRNDYNSLGDRDVTLFNSSMKKKDLLEPIFDAHPVAERLYPSLETKLRDESSVSLSFPIAIKGKRFRGINIDAHVWRMVGQSLVNVLEDYLEQRYSCLPHSSYFDLPKMQILKDPYCGPDTFVSCGERVVKAIVGRKEETNLIPKVSKYKHIDFRDDDKRLRLDEKGEEAISEISKLLTQRFNEEIAKRIEESKRNKKASQYFSIHKFLSEDYFPFEFRESFRAWMSGLYFNKEGIFDTSASRVLVREHDSHLASDWIEDDKMHMISNSYHEITKKLLGNIDEGDTVLMIYVGGGGTGIGYKRTDATISPTELFWLGRFDDLMEFRIKEGIMDNSQLERKTWDTKMKSGVPYMNHDGEVSWIF